MKTLVLLPSIALDEASWQWLDLPSGARAVMHTYPGHAPGCAWSPGMSLADVADMVAESYPGALHLVGVSLGGMVAQHLAMRHPDRVASMLIAGAAATVDPATMTARAEAAEAGTSEGDAAGTLARWFTPGAIALSPEHAGVAYARRRLTGIDPMSLAAAWRAIAAHDLRGRLGGVEAPVTCVAGDQDKAAPVTALQALASEFRRARLRVLRAPHLMQVECPEEFSVALQEHLEFSEAAS